MSDDENVDAGSRPSLEDSLADLDDGTREFILNEVRGARSEAKNLRDRLRDAEPKITEYDRLVEASKTELERAQESATAAESRIAKLLEQAVTAEVKAAAADRFADPSDALLALKGKESTLFTEDGAVNGDAIKAALDELAASRPHWLKNTAPQPPKPIPGQGGGTGVPSLTEQAAAAAKAGDVRQSMRLKAQALVELQNR
jgi:hypothetical protein